MSQANESVSLPESRRHVRRILLAMALGAAAGGSGCQVAEGMLFYGKMMVHDYDKDVSRQPGAWGGFVKGGIYRVNKDIFRRPPDTDRMSATERPLPQEDSPYLSAGSKVQAIKVRYHDYITNSYRSVVLRCVEGPERGRTLAFNQITVDCDVILTTPVVTAGKPHSLGYPIAPNPEYLTLECQSGQASR